MTSSSNVLQETIPALAAALGHLRSAPGRNEGWLNDALSALERTDLPRYERMRRRTGFARRLADLATLDADETAELTLGLFFHELIDGQPAQPGPARRSAWLEYLLRSDDWLTPAFELCSVLGTAGWEPLDSKVTAVGKLTMAFDTETLERHNRPLHVLQNMRGDFETPLVGELIQLLLTEAGQELCDHHFRRNSERDKVGAAELRISFEVLRRRAPTALAEQEAAAITPIGLFGKALPSGGRETAIEPQELVPTPQPRAHIDQPGTPPPTVGNFDRRREALRARSAHEFAEGSPPQERHEYGPAWLPPIAKEPVIEDLPQDSSPPSTENHSQDSSPTGNADMLQQSPPTGMDEGVLNEVRVGLARREEDTMEQARLTSAARPAPSDLLEMMQKLRDVRLQLGEIQRMATAAEALLTGLAPQLDGVTSWIAEIDAVVDRWRGGTDIERAA